MQDRGLLPNRAQHEKDGVARIGNEHWSVGFFRLRIDTLEKIDEIVGHPVVFGRGLSAERLEKVQRELTSGISGMNVNQVVLARCRNQAQKIGRQISMSVEDYDCFAVFHVLADEVCDVG